MAKIKKLGVGYSKRIGIYRFDSMADDLAFMYMWGCLCNMSWYGQIECILRIIFKRPPTRYWDIYNSLKE